MKKLLYALPLFFCAVSFGQVKISDFSTYIGNPSGGWVPVVIAGANRKVDAFYFAANKVDTSKYRIDSLATASLLALKVGTAKYATDSAATVSAIAAKVKYTDTAAMLSTYARTIAVPTNNNQLTNGAGFITASGITGKVNYTDTASMLVPYVLKTKHTADSGTIRAAIPTNNNQLTNGSNYITSAGAPVQTVAGRTGAVVIGESDVTNLTTDLAAKASTASVALKNNISDTAAMLSNYDRTNARTAAVALKVNISDTAAMLASYPRNSSPVFNYTLRNNIISPDSVGISIKTAASPNQNPFQVTDNTGTVVMRVTNTGGISAPLVYSTGGGQSIQFFENTNIRFNTAVPNNIIIDHFTGNVFARLAPRILTTASSATIGLNFDSTDLRSITALAANVTFSNPTGLHIADGKVIKIRLKDNGTARTITWDTQYRAGTTLSLPTTTVAGKWMYLEFTENLIDSKWDLTSLTNGF